ncbi:hypothetical protein BEWA_039110 [Theileria equi strain WA]|uniref:Uncharacterized protein n=1 Tax=Theileria equi strain WA TaxID=1537102 RepID=L1LFE9_THEEQ|nr:hypothetical protein BEWA_039110 [Theileria equi strain WA]EKX73873.1 hypothetical protein BEWA_039110 [Theileria equi strain WA]|eukprot:XP_004833325.1 hypothetical protein BEWA_039110 [Theileria equi strain WA]
MGAGKTCTNGSWVDIDIGKTAAGDGKYKDACDNTINVHKTDDKPDKGYKRYTHSFSSNQYIGGIYYNGKQQDSIRVTDSAYYEKSVTVYYLGYDDIHGKEKNMKLIKKTNFLQYSKKSVLS